MSDDAWNTTRASPQPCPWCGKELDAFSGEGRGPRAGDMSVCIDCAQPVIIGENLTLRRMTKDDIATLTHEESKQLSAYMLAIRNLDRR